MSTNSETAATTPSFADPNKPFLDAISPEILANVAEIESGFDEHRDLLLRGTYGEEVLRQSEDERRAFVEDERTCNLVMWPVLAIALWLGYVTSPHPLAPPQGTSLRARIKHLLGFVDSKRYRHPFVWHLCRHLFGSDQPLSELDHWLAATLKPEHLGSFGFNEIEATTADRARLLIGRAKEALGGTEHRQRATAVYCLSKNLKWWRDTTEVSALLPSIFEFAFSSRARQSNRAICDLPGACSENLGRDQLLTQVLAFCGRVDRGELGEDEHSVGSGWSLGMKWSSEVCQPITVRLLSTLSDRGGPGDATDRTVAQFADACSRSPTFAEAFGSVIFDEQLSETLLNQCGPRIRALFCSCPHLLHWCLDQVLKLPENEIRRSYMDSSPWFKTLAAWLKGQNTLIDAAKAHPVPAARLLMLSLVQTPETDPVISELVTSSLLVGSDSAWVGLAANQPHGALSVEVLLNWFAQVASIKEMALSAQLQASIAQAPLDRRSAWVHAVLERHLDGDPKDTLYVIQVALQGLDGVIPVLAKCEDSVQFEHLPFIGTLKARKEATNCLKRLKAGSASPTIPHQASVLWLSDWCGPGLIEDGAMVDGLVARLFNKSERFPRSDGGNHPHNLSMQSATRLLDWFASNSEATWKSSGHLKLFALCSAIALCGDKHSIRSLVEIAGSLIEHAGHSRDQLVKAIAVFVANLPPERRGPVTHRLSMALPAKAVTFVKQPDHEYSALKSLREAMLFEPNGWRDPEPLRIGPLYRAMAALGQSQAGHNILSDGKHAGSEPEAADAAWPALAENLGAQLLCVDEPSINSAAAALEELIERARTELMGNLKAALNKAGLGDDEVARVDSELAGDYPTRSRLERALKAAKVPKEHIAKILDRVSDERLPALLGRALTVCVGLPMEHWKNEDDQEGLGDIRAPKPENSLSVSGLVVERLCAVYADQPATLARIVVKVLDDCPSHNPDAYPSLRGLMYALGKLREPLGGASPKALLRIADDETLPAPLRKTAGIQKALFERDALNRGRHRKAEGRMADALASIRQGCADSAAGLLGDRFATEEDARPVSAVEMLFR